MEPVVGFEPTTDGLQIRFWHCATNAQTCAKAPCLLIKKAFFNFSANDEFAHGFPVPLLQLVARKSGYVIYRGVSFEIIFNLQLDKLGKPSPPVCFLRVAIPDVLANRYDNRAPNSLNVGNRHKLAA